MPENSRAQIMSELIDVHAHYFPPTGPIDSTQRAALLEANNFAATGPSSVWESDAAVEFMDAHGIAVQLLSMPGELPVDQARRTNDFGAELVAGDPTRTGLLANLPLGDPDAAAAEVGRAWDELNADGFVIVTNYAGAYLGDPRFDGVFAELDRRQATVFVHPTAPAGFESTACGRPGPVIEFPFDTARTVVDAAYARLFQRYPNFNMVLAHAGGALSVLAERVATIGTHPWVPNPGGVSADDIRTQLGGLYYDTAIAGTAASLLPLLQVTTADHVVFGTDYPPAEINVIEANLDALTHTTVLTEQQLMAMAPTALNLFPRLKQRLSAR